MVTRFFLQYDGLDEINDLITRCAAAEDVSKVVLCGGKKACADLAVGGQADAGTGSAEHFGHRGYDPDLARSTVGKSVFPGGLAAACFVYRNERVDGVDGLEDLTARDDHLTAPFVAAIERHKFDEPHRNVILAGESGKIDEFIIVMAPDDGGVDLNGRKSVLLRGLDRGEDLIKGVDAGDLFELFTIEAVEAYSDAVDARIL